MYYLWKVPRLKCWTTLAFLPMTETLHSLIRICATLHIAKCVESVWITVETRTTYESISMMQIAKCTIFSCFLRKECVHLFHITSEYISRRSWQYPWCLGTFLQCIGRCDHWEWGQCKRYLCSWASWMVPLPSSLFRYTCTCTKDVAISTVDPISTGPFLEGTNWSGYC